MAIFDFDVTAQSFGSWASVDAAGRAATQQEVIILSEELAKTLRDEFAAGGHNKTGETMDSITVRLGPLSAEVSMAGGGWFVEHGFPGHYIEVNQAQALHWEADDKFEEGFARPGVWVSGYEGDPFVERAMEDIDYGQALQTIAEKMFKAIVSSQRLTFISKDITEGEAEALQSTQDINLTNIESDINLRADQEFGS